MHTRGDDPEALERAVREAYEAPEPPAGFADRVLAAREAPAEGAPRRARRQYIRVGAFVGLGGVAAAALVLLSMTGDPSVRGARLATARETVAVGARGVMVLEPGADVAYEASGGSARVEQRGGRVFYRVDRAARTDASFVVATPAGEVRVRGTCFSVEVMPMMPSKSAWKGAVVGAVVSSVVLVTVLEGRVLLASPQGQVEVGAGQTGRLVPGAAPVRAEEAELAAPAESASVEELRRRDDAQRLEIATLRAKVKALETQGKRGQPGEGDEASSEITFVDPPKEKLAELARDCRLEWDSPSLGAEPTTMGPKRQKEAGLSDEQVAGFNRVSAELHARVAGELRALYGEVIGDAAAARDLSPSTMMQEIESKSPETDVQEAFRRISAERAGLARPPTAAELKARPPVERMLRRVTSLGETFEREVGEAIGKEKAHALRRSAGGWGSRSSSSHGCPGEKPE